MTMDAKKNFYVTDRLKEVSDPKALLYFEAEQYPDDQVQRASLPIGVSKTHWCLTLTFRRYRFQIAPSELEDLLLRHPHVTDAAVCAIYDNKQASEVPLAYVSLTQEYAVSPHATRQEILDGIRNWLDRRVAGYKKLRGGVFQLQDLPKTSSGKILRRDLPAKLKEARDSRI
jgi:acyl-CoA synthetase (AMP-forming)/AMP-acid ligase II